METVNQVIAEFRKAKQRPYQIFVDTIGLGAGVYDRLKQLSYPVFPAIVSQRATRQELKNMRAEMYFNLKDKLELGLKVVNDSDLLMELTNIRYIFDNQGRLFLEPKEKLKQRLGRSPDCADAVALTCYMDVYQEIKGQDDYTTDDFEMPTAAAGY